MLKSMRLEKKLTQREAAEIVGISLRSYKSYENDQSKKDTIKYKYIIDKISEINRIDEEHGILEKKDICSICKKVISNYDVEYCYLFGSYAKETANEQSDVDLLISSKITGLKFYALVEDLRNGLKKKVDVLNINQLKENFELTCEVLKDGVRIYG